MTNLDKAREWAKINIDSGVFPQDHRIRVASEIIQSLPDQWVDVEKVREAISGQLSVYTRGTVSHYIAEEITRNLEALIAPKLPTLAELIKQGNDPEQYRWMQAKVFHTEELGCVTNFDLFGECATALFPNGVAKSVPYEDITLLPDLPKLEWPGNEVAETPALPEGMRLADHKEYGRVVVSPKVDTDDDYKVFLSGTEEIAGATWKYADKSELTFLGGDQRA